MKTTAYFPVPLLHMGLNFLSISLGAMESLDNNGDDGKELRLCKQGHAGKPVKGSSINLLGKGRDWSPGAFPSQLLWLFPSLIGYAGTLMSDLSLCWTNVYSAGLRRIFPSVRGERMKSLGLVTLARLNTAQVVVAELQSLQDSGNHTEDQD